MRTDQPMAAGVAHYERTMILRALKLPFRRLEIDNGICAIAGLVYKFVGAGPAYPKVNDSGGLPARFENGGTLRVFCEGDGADLTVRISAVRDPESTRAKPADAEFERSLAVAAALLDSSGAVLEAQDEGVSIRLPRVRTG